MSEAHARAAAVKVLALCGDGGVPVDGAKGATVHLVELWRALARRGARVTGLAPWRGGRLPATGSGLEIVAVGAGGRDARQVRSRLLDAAEESARTERPDGLLERLALGSRLGIELRRSTGAPLVVEVNAPLDREATRFRGAPQVSDLAAISDTLEAADFVYCVSHPLIEWALGLGARPDRVDLIANGVDVAAFHRPATSELPPTEGADDDDGRTRDRALRIGFVGSFKPWHGLEHLVEAVALARASGIDLELHLLGEGPERARLEEQAQERGLTAHVRFLGARGHEQVPAFLHGLDVAVAPGTSAEDYYFSPLKLFEYAAAGCAIIAPAAGQVPEWFRHGIEAWLVPPGSARELAQAIERLARDPALRRKLGAVARARAEREFDWAHAADRILGWMRNTRPVAIS